MSAVKKVLVVGGGIAGMALAAGLARIGIEVEVVERRNGEVHGSGLGFMPYAIRALGTIGLKDQVMSVGYASSKVHLCDAAGQILRTTVHGQVLDTDLPAEFLISRTSLATVLNSAVIERGAKIRYNLEVADLQNSPTSVSVKFSDGSEGEYDLLVGADGAHSKIRERYVHPNVAPTVLDSGSWRALLKYSDVLPIGHAFQGEGKMVYMYPTGDGQIYAGLSTNRAEARYDDKAGRIRLKELLGEFNAPQTNYFRDQVDAAKEVTYRSTSSLLVPRPWFVGRIVLIGDAAHTMPANLSGGGSMAVEDAAVLVDTITNGDDITSILQIFENRRYPRVKRVVEDSLMVRKNGTSIDVWGGESSVYRDITEWLMQPA